ncbi:PKD domain-containing protein, partial [bacterium]|nr:PKD domain-containing protein [bacterium]
YYLFDDISTGRYNYIVKASGHDSLSNSVIISPEIQTLVEPVLLKNILGVQLTVTPILIEDEYDIELDLTFETEVPPPLLIPSPLYIRYGVNFTDPENETDGDIVISNPGLISIFNVTVDSSLLAGVNISFPTGKIFFIDELKAKSSVTIPYHLNVTDVTCDSDSKRNDIKINGEYIYFEEYSGLTHKVYLSSEIPVFIHMFNCPVSSGIPGEEIVDHFTYYYHSPGGGYSPGPSPPGQINTVENVRERIKFTISQEATLERDAFAASLELTNKLSDKNIESVNVDIEIKDKEGIDASGMFYVNQTFLDNINSIDGSGVINPSSIATADWLLIPIQGAGGTSPEGNDYTAQAFIDYTVDGVPFSVNSTEEWINVMPQPLLNLTYMIPGEVKADTPFNITLNVTNVGYGTARNLKLDSAQPVIYENLAGLLVSFELIGSGIEGGAESDSMLINFGDIAPGESKTGYWIMTASLDGEFTEFKGSFSHSNALGGAETSLIENITYVITQFTAEIISPEDGGIFYDSDPIVFEGTAHNGTEPYSYEWRTNYGGLLSSEPSFNEKLSAGSHEIKLIVTDKNGITDIDTHLINVNRETMEVSVGAKYNQKSKTLDISAYAVDKSEGGVVNSGVAKYELLDFDGNPTGFDGDLLYDSNSEEWEANNLNLLSLAAGDYYVKVIIKTPTGYGIGELPSPFIKLEGHGSLFGYLIDGTKSSQYTKVNMPNVEVKLYISNELYKDKENAQPIATNITDSTGMYTFD